jgi:tetratricopeptide (TPR) repeat protein
VGNAIARQIVATLDPSATIRTRAVDPAVYDLYLRGRFLWNRRRGEEMERAKASFAEAVRLDPSFAPAYAGLADSLLVSSRPAALTAAEQALAVDDRLAEAHTARAHALMHMLQWGRAEEAFRRAIALDPSYVPARYFYSEYLLARGRCQEARAEAFQGQTLDPLSSIAAHVVGVTLYYCRDFDGALPHFRKALALDPEHYWSHYRIALVLEQQRAYDEAFSEFARVVPAGLASAYAYGVAGRTAEARRIVRKSLAAPERESLSYHLAGAYVGLGQYDKALEWLSVALTHQVYQVVFMRADPRLDPLRSRPEFQALLREGGWG